jgi:hypothetical protein
MVVESHLPPCTDRRLPSSPTMYSSRKSAASYGALDHVRVGQCCGEAGA